MLVNIEFCVRLQIHMICCFFRFDHDTILDIALIRVNGTILFGDKVMPINLPSCDFEVKRDGESK